MFVKCLANQKHQNKLNELFEMKGLLYISTPRPGLKRGGGVAIAADPSKFSLSKLNVPNPHQLEVAWGLLKPKQVTGTISKIICCAFYSPPYSKKKTKLIDHLFDTLQELLLDHPGAGLVRYLEWLIITSLSRRCPSLIQISLGLQRILKN